VSIAKLIGFVCIRDDIDGTGDGDNRACFFPANCFAKAMALSQRRSVTASPTFASTPFVVRRRAPAF
jgi:hypothetical protein